MIRSSAVTLALWAGLLVGGRAHAQSETASETPSETPDGSPLPATEDPLSPYRTKFDVLTERTIGTASKPVVFDWRRTTAHVAVTGDFLFELNNFNSLRAGGMVRVPTAGMVVEIGASYARVWDTPSSRLLALTPYRQPGRPNRIDLDIAVALPLAEGVITASPRFFPAAQLVFDVYAGFRYSIYPTGWGGMRPGRVLSAIFSPSLTEKEIENLDDARLDAMQVDPGRYGLMVGFGNDLYFEQGFFVSPRVMLSLPILAPASGTELYFWADVTLAVGMAF
ncbi:MAG: hypothetical protein R3F61_04160 [Myxococcota bacterium]